MNKTSDGGPERMEKVDVPIVGFERSVAVLIASEKLPEGAEIFAPDTRHLKVFAAHDRGTNYHGSLRDEFFVCGSDGYVNNWIILWVTLNASQIEDDIQRMKPFCMLSTAWQPDDLDDKIASLIENFDAMELNGLILLCAYANYTAKSWDHDFPDAEIEHGAIKAEIAALALQGGASGKPLDLLQLSQKQ